MGECKGLEENVGRNVAMGWRGGGANESQGVATKLEVRMTHASEDADMKTRGARLHLGDRWGTV